MAVGSHGTKSDSGADYAASGAQFVEYEEFIEAQLRKTRSQVRGVDIATATMVLLASTLGYFFVAVLVDHWLVSGGLGFWGRTILLALYLVAAGWWTISQIMPLLLRRINPLYAAQTIEHSRPTLKNALVNFLLFRSDPQAVHQRVFEQIEQQAATSLVGVEVESTVDRSQLVKIGYVLVALVAVGAIYALVSPKNPFKTVSRVFMPWADIAPPTSTVIDEIEPGSTQAFRGQQVTVKARVQGLPDGEQVLLYYTTADRQIVDRAVEMARPSGDYRHAAVLPAGDAALQQSITYRIEAGDAKSRDYQIEVVSAPTIVVQSVEYKYPAYTGLLGQRVEHQGDLKAIEGTEVTLEGVANQPIGKAYVDFEANGSLDLTMRPEGTTARTSFRLGMSEDRKKPEYELYQLIFKNPDGQQNPQPVRHRIEVIADLAPEIQFVDPTREEIEIPLDGSAELELVASDPDFALADVRLVMQHGGKPLVDEKLLKEPWRGQFVKKQRFSPKAHQLAAGEVVEYYAVAVDNKLPVPNRTETSRRRIRISSPTGRGEDDQLAQKDAGGEQESGDRSQSQSGGDGERPRDEQPEAAEQESQAQGQGANSSPEDAAARNEPDQQPPADDQPGEQNAEQEKQSQDAGNESGDQAGSKDSAGDREGPSGDQNEPQPSGEEQPAGENSDSGESSDGGSQQGKQSGGKQSGGKQSGEQQEGGQSGEQPSGSEQDSSEQGGSGEQQSEGSAGQKQGKQGQNQSGGKQSGKGQAGQQQESDDVASDGTNDGDAIERILKHRDQQDPNAGNQAGEKSTGKDQPTAKQSSGDKQAAGKQAGNQQSGNQSGQKPTGSKQQGQQESGQQRGSGQEQGSKSDANHSAQEQADPAQQQNGKQPGGQQQKDKSGDAKSTSGNEADKAEQGQPSDTNQQASDQQGASDAGERAGDQSGSKPGAKQQPERTPGEGQQSTENSSGDKSGGEQQEPTSREGNQGDQGATRDNNTREDGSPQKTDTQGQGGQSKDDPTRSPDQKPQQSSQQRPDAKGGDGQQEKGESGAGKKSEDNAGSPSPQESNQPREKSQQPGSENAEEKPEGDEQSPSTSKRESDSSGESDGDRSGGGEKGGGQKANQSGTGGAGQNTAADEGAGQSDEAGDGETSDRAGGDRESKDQTGQQGKQPGQGSQMKNGAGQEQAGGDQAPSQPGGEPSNDQNSGGEGSGTPGGDQGGANTPKGAGNSAPDKPWQAGVDHADDANLDYTRQATDLALEHLKDQLADGRDDSELLKQLGWTREEADAFVQRWETMRGQAQSSGPKGDTARRELDETLRSLGLRPRGSAIRAGGKADDRVAGLQESRRTTPPPEYSEAFKAYTQGTSRGGK